MRPVQSVILHGDCVEMLATLAADSVDAVITDPPYGIGFMGKEWDTFTPGLEAARVAPNSAITSENPNLKGRQRSPATSPSAVEYDYSRSGLVAFERWTETWARAAIRVLKPGGHAVVCGAPRAFHRMACGLEDAGFEIRDCLSWLYGQGFPKSLNVAKALSKRRTDDVRPVCRFLRAAIEARGMTARAVADRFGFDSRMVDHWAARDTDSQPTVPTREQWTVLKSMLAFGDGMDAEVDRLNARKGDVGDEYKTSPIVRNYDTSPGGVGDGPFRVREYADRAPVGGASVWVGWGTALKPGWEPIVLARKPFQGTLVDNVLKHGTGALNVDACRIGTDVRFNPPASTVRVQTMGRPEGAGSGWREGGESVGRWPANVCLDEIAAIALDEQSGELASNSGEPFTRNKDEHRDVYGAFNGTEQERGYYGDNGGASRFYYVAKPSRTERDLGCVGLAKRSPGACTDRSDGSDGLRSPRAGAGRTGGGRNFHPTVKPVELMRWLVRLVTPQDGTVVDPFLGSGTTGMACRHEHMSFIGIEREAEYVDIAERRLDATPPTLF